MVWCLHYLFVWLLSKVAFRIRSLPNGVVKEMRDWLSSDAGCGMKLTKTTEASAQSDSVHRDYLYLSIYPSRTLIGRPIRRYAISQLLWSQKVEDASATFS